MTPPTTFTTLTTRPPWGRAVVTGGAGFLGSHMCERLLDEGVEVDCVDNLSSGAAGNIGHLAGRPVFRFLEYDVSEPGWVDELGGSYDLVLHFSCPVSPAGCPRPALETLDAGSLGTRNALAMADRDGARFLLASTSEVHGDPLVRFSEVLATAYVRDRGTDAGIVRVSNTYGPRMRADDGRAVPTFINQALAGGPVNIAGDGSQKHSLCYVDDTVEGVLLVAASRSVRPVDIGGGDETTVLETARRVIDLTGSDARLEFVDPPSGAVAPVERRPDTTFARELFGWVPKVTWEEGLERTVAHFLSRPEDGRPTPEPYGRSLRSA
ncbi:NAD-dependent epimerase/dehydratase family protein [Streptomyces sp. HC44]|uniref:NAD-dependent epimerase/dehydratase family protein n=1 Tax=Streptomyces scabichelini TaxID=2711217 RepID=A0A6G4VDB4_9ACTN|nr:NAD-dependent epimerase/dehydratase family protein [Streptomyces scabichelini]NGO11794.1 NAD-dependent epimerase/dehydratase family protein [Streptomyces scabichelini]